MLHWKYIHFVYFYVFFNFLFPTFVFKHNGPCAIVMEDDSLGEVGHNFHKLITNGLDHINVHIYIQLKQH